MICGDGIYKNKYMGVGVGVCGCLYMYLYMRYKVIKVIKVICVYI